MNLSHFLTHVHSLQLNKWHSRNFLNLSIQILTTWRRQDVNVLQLERNWSMYLATKHIAASGLLTIQEHGPRLVAVHAVLLKYYHKDCWHCKCSWMCIHTSWGSSVLCFRNTWHGSWDMTHTDYDGLWWEGDRWTWAIFWPMFVLCSWTSGIQGWLWHQSKVSLVTQALVWNLTVTTTDAMVSSAPYAIDKTEEADWKAIFDDW